MKLRLKNNSEFFDFDNLMAECTENGKIIFVIFFENIFLNSPTKFFSQRAKIVRFLEPNKFDGASGARNRDFVVRFQ